MSTARVGGPVQLKEAVDAINRIMEREYGHGLPRVQDDAHWARICAGALPQDEPLQRDTVSRQINEFMAMLAEQDICRRCSCTELLRDKDGRPVGMAGCPLHGHYLELTTLTTVTIRHDEAGHLMPENQHYPCQVARFSKILCVSPLNRLQSIKDRARSAPGRRQEQIIPGEWVRDPGTQERTS